MLFTLCKIILLAHVSQRCGRCGKAMAPGPGARDHTTRWRSLHPCVWAVRAVHMPEKTKAEEVADGHTVTVVTVTGRRLRAG